MAPLSAAAPGRNETRVANGPQAFIVLPSGDDDGGGGGGGYLSGGEMFRASQ